MPGVKVDTPPLSVQIVDPQTGLPTRAMADFMHRLWERSGGNDDESDFLLKLFSGSRYQNNQVIESQTADQSNFDIKRTQFDPNKSKKAYENRVPKGGIIAFHGAIEDIPTGWFLCDGNNDTPNLLDRFIVGAGGNKAVGDTGGKEEHETTVAGTTSGSDVDAVTDATIPTMPPWYALAYIMKG